MMTPRGDAPCVEATRKEMESKIVVASVEIFYSERSGSGWIPPAAYANPLADAFPAGKAPGKTLKCKQVICTKTISYIT